MLPAIWGTRGAMIQALTDGLPRVLLPPLWALSLGSAVTLYKRVNLKLDLKERARTSDILSPCLASKPYEISGNREVNCP
jgi:hypothetical protein